MPGGVGRPLRRFHKGHPGACNLVLMFGVGAHGLSSSPSESRLSLSPQSNYMYEWEWLLGECPRLMQVPVLACYGDSNSTATITNVRPCAMAVCGAAVDPLYIPTHMHTRVHTYIQSFPRIETFKPAIKRSFQYGTCKLAGHTLSAPPRPAFQEGLSPSNPPTHRHPSRQVGPPLVPARAARHDHHRQFHPNGLGEQDGGKWMYVLHAEASGFMRLCVTRADACLGWDGMEWTAHRRCSCRTSPSSPPAGPTTRASACVRAQKTLLRVRSEVI